MTRDQKPAAGHPEGDAGGLMRRWLPVDAARRAAARRRMQRLAEALALTYGTPDLGNLADPLDEAVYILLTYQTDLQRAQEVWKQLRARFSEWGQLLEAPVEELEELLKPSGLQRQRARTVRQLLAAVQSRWGELSLRALEQLPDEATEVELRSLPGFDIKGARCVMMYSLRRQVFPVDSNAFRFMQRYGVVHPTAPYRRKTTHDKLQDIVAPADRHSLHVNLVVHGQRTCVPRNPRCEACAVRRTCEANRRAASRGEAAV